MKLHLPLPLLKALSLLAAACYTIEPAEAIVMHSDVTFQTYTDFGQNLGRYVVGTKVNSLLQHIRERDGGVTISYTVDKEPYVIPNSQGMINFTATIDEGDGAMISPNFLASSAHVWSLNASFSARLLGEEHRISYSAIDSYESTVFRLNPHWSSGPVYDYMLNRQSKIVTDATWNELTSITDVKSLEGSHLYHSGAGSKGLYDANTGEMIEWGGAYVYITGSINEINEGKLHDAATNNSFFTYLDYDGASPDNPIPSVIRSGDSGSPAFIYNAGNKRYEYVAAQQSGGGTMSQSRGNWDWTREMLAKYNVAVDMGSTSVVYLNAADIQGETRTDNYGVTATEWFSTVTDGQQNELCRVSAVQSGVNTWSNLLSLKDTQNWYAYRSDDYLALSDADLFFTQNLIFTATQEENQIILTDSVDLGIGYAEFNNGKFTIISEGEERNLFNHAGYVINEGAEVHLRLNNDAAYMFEWRKNGAGDLYIDGEGDTNALLALGGTGTTYLQQKNGHAAYNVIVGSGATVQIQDKGQIVRDFTFGHGGGTLDMNGNSMEWYTTAETSPDSSRFSINTLTEEAMLYNSTGAATLTYMEGGETTYLGSFRDSESGSLLIDYRGGGTWTLNSIHTDLHNHTDSGLLVSNGKVVFKGTNTLHGRGSLNGRTAERILKENDWHYADATMDVTVKNGATFELGSHARLIGDIAVESGGTYVMREGVQSAWEYVEGGAILEETSQYQCFYGHKGDVQLAEGATMQIAYSAGVTVASSFEGNITGSGDVSVALGTSVASLTLKGNNSFAGQKTLTSGGLIGEYSSSLGDTTADKWVVTGSGWLASHADSAQAVLARIDAASTGTIALSADTAEQLDLSTHQGLYLGAEAGRTVEYGAAGTSEQLAAVQADASGNLVWKLGGGGGTLNVNYRLSGEHDLLLGAASDSVGYVHLANSTNDFSGNILFNSAGIRLSYADGALGQAMLNLIYGTGAVLQEGSQLGNVSFDSEGILLLDKHPGSVELSGHAQLALGSSTDTRYTGDITLAEGQAYRFSVMDGATFTLASQLEAGRDMILDAQGYSGGTVQLEEAAAFDGVVTVMGHKDGQGGNMTLGFVGDNSLVNAASVIVKDGSVIDVAGTTQIINNIQLEEGSSLRGGAAGKIVFNMTGDAAGYRQLGSIDVAAVEKTGSGQLLLGSTDSNWETLTIKEGSVVVDLENTLPNQSLTRVENGGVLIMRTLDSSRHVKANVVLGDGGRMQTEANGGHGLYLTGSISVDAGATGYLDADSGIWILQSADYNLNGGTLAINSGTLWLNQSFAQRIGGTVDVVRDSVSIISRASATDMVKRFDHLHVGTAKTLTLDENSWNTIWQLDKLTGDGSVCWNSNTNHSETARLVIGGEGAFSGAISMNRHYGNDVRTHQAFLQINGESAVQDASVLLTGGNNSYATLAINADKVRIRGLSGNTFTHVMLGESPTDSASSTAPQSTRSSRLVLTGNEDYTFSGSIGTADDAADCALSIEKTGAGSQTLDGAYVALGDVSVLGGALHVTSETLTVGGDVEMTAGASLTLGETYTLGSGRSFSVVPGGAVGAPAGFNSLLVLDGGALNLDLGGLTAESAVLNLAAGVSIGSGVILNLSNTGNLQAGSTFTLISGNGDWSALEGKMQIAGLDYLGATLAESSAGLSLTFTLNGGYAVWGGTAEEHVWGPSQFGNTPGSASSVVFDSTGACKTVTVEGEVAVEHATFNSNEDYVVEESETGGLATIGSLEHKGQAATTLSSAVQVTGATMINSGTLVLQDTEILGGAVSGEGTLEIAWESGAEDTLALENIRTLKLTSGKLVADGAGLSGTQSLSISSAAELCIAAGTDVSISAALLADGGRLSKTGDGRFTWNTSGDNLALDSVSVAGGTLTLNLTGGALTVSEVSGSGTLEKTGTGAVCLHSVDGLATLVLKGGEANLHGSVELSNQLSIGKGEVNLCEGADVTASCYTGGNTADGNPSVVNISAGAKLTISGNSDVDDTHASLLLAHWKNSASSLVLEGGTLTALDSRMLMGWNSGGTFSAVSGTADLKGILFTSKRDYVDRFLLGTSDEGCAEVTLGVGGISGMKANDMVQLGRGTLKASADFAISGDCSLTLVAGGDGTIIDTNGHTVTVNTALQGSGSMVKRGNGTLHLAGANESTGGVKVQGGTLQLTGAPGACAYEVAENATLMLTHGSDTAASLSGVEGDGVLHVNSAGSLSLGAASVGRIVLHGGGETNMTGTVNVSSQLSIGSATLNIGSGAVVSAPQLTGSDGAANVSTTINIDGGELRITGNINDQGKANSLMLTHWLSSSTVLNLNSGKLDAAAAVMTTSWDSKGAFNAMGGEAILLGINLHGHSYSDRNGTFTLGSQDEGAAVVRIGGQGIKGLSGGGSVILGNGMLVATDNFSIEGDNAVQLIGSKGGTTIDTADYAVTLNPAISGAGKLNKSGAGSLVLNGNTEQYTGAVTINAGALVLGSSAQGLLASAEALVVNEGSTLDLSAATVSADLLNQVSGEGTVILNYDVHLNGTGFDFSNFSGNVQLDKGRVLISSSTFGSSMPDFTLTSGNSQLVFNANDTVLNSNIYLKAGTTLHANTDKDGEITGDVSGAHALTKNSPGKLTLSGQLDVSTLNVEQGELVLSWSGANGNRINMLDSSMGKTATGKLRLARNSHLSVNGAIWGWGATSVVLEEGALLANSQDSVAFSNRGAAKEATLRFYGDSEGEYALSGAWELINGHLAYTGSAGADLGNKLTDSSLEHAGSGTLNVNNAANNISSLSLTGGHVKLSENMTVQRISATSGKTVTVSSGKSIAMAGAVSLAANEADATLTALNDNALAGLQNGTAFTIQDMVLTNLAISAVDSEQPVILQNVTAHNVVLNQGAFTLQMATPSVEKAESGNVALTYTTGISGLTNGAVLTLVADPSVPVGGATALVDLEFVLTGFSTGPHYSAGSLTGLKETYGIEFGGWLARLLNPAAETVAAAEVLSEGETVSQKSAGVYTVSYGAGSGTNVGNLVICISGLQVPETSTSTLSLLALVGLAARRRRK